MTDPAKLAQMDREKALIDGTLDKLISAHRGFSEQTADSNCRVFQSDGSDGAHRRLEVDGNASCSSAQIGRVMFGCRCEWCGSIYESGDWCPPFWCDSCRWGDPVQYAAAVAATQQGEVA